MAKGTEHARDVEARAEALLSANAAPDASSLIALIREVNPTSRTLPSRAIERRYALKNALQSLLIRTFGDALAIEPGPMGSPDVGLRHRYLGLDACHARVDALDEDARAWVRLQLDLGTPEHHAEVRDRGGDEAVDDTPLGLVRRGRAAMREYDYEAAESLLREAFARSEGASFAAAALLELLVDVLVQDEAALALVPAFSRTARTQPALRGALALAAIRAERFDEGRAFLAGASGARAFDAQALLVREALRCERPGEAETLLEELHKQDPGHRELYVLRQEIEQHRKERERPLLEAKRREREAEQRAQAEALAAATAAAARAEEAGDLDAALRAWARAEALGADVAAELSRLHRKRAAELRQQAMVHVAEKLSSPSPDAADLVAWGALEPEARAEVRGRLASGSPGSLLTGWMSELHLGSTAHVRAAAEAVLALAEAERELVAGRPEAALARLHPHERILAELPEARRLADWAHAIVKEQAQEERRRREEERRQKDEELHALRRAELRHARRREAEEAAGRGDFLEAQRRGRMAMRSEEDPAARETWVPRLAGWSRQVARAWRVWSIEGALADAGVDELDACLRLADCREALTREGRYVAVVAFGRELFLLQFDVTTRRVVQLTRWRLPERLQLVSGSVGDDSLFVLGAEGQLVELDRRDGGIRRWLSLRDLLHLDTVAANYVVAPGATALLWFGDERAGITVFDPDTGEVTWRDPLHYDYPFALPTAGGPVLPFCCGRRPSSVRRPDGRAISLPFWPGDRRVTGVAIHPDGRGYLASHAIPRKDATGSWTFDRQGPFVLRIATGGSFTDLELAPPEGWVQLDASVASGLAYALLQPAGPPAATLVAFRMDGVNPVELWRVPVQAEGIVSDERCGRVVLTECGPSRVVELLGTEPPVFAEPALVAREDRWPRLSTLDCGHGPELPNAEMRRDMLAYSDADFTWYLEQMERRRMPADVLRAASNTLLRGITAENRPTFLARTAALTDLGLRLHPEAPLVRLAAAHARAHAGAWEAVRALLEDGGPTGLHPHDADHWLHLLGAARLRAGDVEGAVEAWTRPVLPPSGNRPSPCVLADLLAHAEILLTPIEKLSLDEQPTTGAFTAAACRLADDAFARGKPEEALRLLWRLDARAVEPQSAARLAKAALDRTGTAPRDDFWTAFLLARYLEVRRVQREGTGKLELKDELHFGPAQWDAAALAGIEERAAAWLETFGAGANADAVAPVRSPA